MVALLVVVSTAAAADQPLEFRDQWADRQVSRTTVQTLDADTVLGTIEHHMEIPVPELPDLVSGSRILASVSVPGAQPDGRFVATFHRRREGALERLGREAQKFGAGFFPNAAFGSFEIDSDTLAAGDTLVIDMSFNGSAVLPADAELFFNGGFIAVTLNTFAAARNETFLRAWPPGQGHVASELDTTRDSIRYDSTVEVEAPSGIGLRRLKRTVELNIEELVVDPDATEIELTYAIQVFPAIDLFAFPTVVFRHRPADGSGRVRLLRILDLMTGNSASGVFFVPMPEGLAAGGTLEATFKFDGSAKSPPTTGSPPFVRLILLAADGDRGL